MAEPSSTAPPRHHQTGTPSVRTVRPCICEHRTGKGEWERAWVNNNNSQHTHTHTGSHQHNIGTYRARSSAVRNDPTMPPTNRPNRASVVPFHNKLCTRPSSLLQEPLRSVDTSRGISLNAMRNEYLHNSTKHSRQEGGGVRRLSPYLSFPQSATVKVSHTHPVMPPRTTPFTNVPTRRRRVNDFTRRCTHGLYEPSSREWLCAEGVVTAPERPGLRKPPRRSEARRFARCFRRRDSTALTSSAVKLLNRVTALSSIPTGSNRTPPFARQQHPDTPPRNNQHAQQFGTHTQHARCRGIFVILTSLPDTCLPR